MDTTKKRLIIGSDVAPSTLSNTHIGLAATIYGTPSNPTGTTSTTRVMMGLAIPFTPLKTGIVKAILSFTGENSTANYGITAQLAYGTGTAPTNGVAATGTAVGTLYSFAYTAASVGEGNTLHAMITGLTTGTPIWIDAQLAALSGGTATLLNLYYIVEELIA